MSVRPLSGLLLALVLPSAAFAQDESPTYGFDAHGFRFVSADSDPRAPLRFYRPGDTPSLGWSLGAVAEYATRPLVFESPDGTRFDASSNLAAVNLAGGFAPVSGLRFDVSAPVVLANTFGGAPGLADGYVTESGGPTFGDLRISVLGAPLRPANGGIGLGLLAALDLPTGDPERWLGTRGPAALLGLAGTAEADALTLNAQLGARLAPNTRPEDRPAPTVGGDTFELAGGLSYLVAPSFGLGLEANASIPIDAEVRAALSVPAEVTLTGRYRTDAGAYLTGGLGVGVSPGAGSSPVRLVVGGGFGTAAERAPRDTDVDGITDRDDTCPLEPETPNGYLDEDGCTDLLPRVVVEARAGNEVLTGALVKVTGPTGVVIEQTGLVTVEGMPGEKHDVVVSAGACKAGHAMITLPAEGSTTTAVPVTRTEGSVLVSVFDATGLPLEGAQVRYIIDDTACRPSDTQLKAGRGTHVMGTGPVKMFVTALGYDVYQTTFTLVEGEQHLVEAKLRSTSVSIKEGRLKVATPLQFNAGTATLDLRSVTTTQQVAALLLSMDVVPKLEIGGYADGRDAKRLSQERADAVRDQLVLFGVPAERLVAAGKGALPANQKEVIVLAVLP